MIQLCQKKLFPYDFCSLNLLKQKMYLESLDEFTTTTILQRLETGIVALMRCLRDRSLIVPAPRSIIEFFISFSKILNIFSIPLSPSLAREKSTGRPRNTHLAPSARHFKTSVPLLIPPST